MYTTCVQPVCTIDTVGGPWWEVEDNEQHLKLYNLSLQTAGVITCNVSNNWGYLIISYYLTVHGRLHNRGVVMATKLVRGDAVDVYSYACSGI